MSKQPRHVRDKLETSKTSLILPHSQDMRQLWLLIRQDPTETSAGCFFISHGRNFKKFHNRKGFEVLGHSFDKSALQVAARHFTLTNGPQFQPKFSAHQSGTVTPWTPEEKEEGQSLDPSIMQPSGDNDK